MSISYLQPKLKLMLVIFYIFNNLTGLFFTKNHPLKILLFVVQNVLTTFNGFDTQTS